MKNIRVAAAVLNQTPFDWASNLRNIRAAIELARADAVNLLCLPEPCITGYGCEDMFLAPGVWETAWAKLQDVDSFVRAIFVGVYQATKNSSETTLEAARELTTALGGEFLSLDVDPIVSLYRDTIEQAIDRKLTWETDDIALQNIQARLAPSQGSTKRSCDTGCDGWKPMGQAPRRRYLLCDS